MHTRTLVRVGRPHPLSRRQRLANRRQPPRLTLTHAWGRPTDPAAWDLSPEWYGRSGGGYGRDDGVVVYRAPSSAANGEVTVTAHPCSIPGREWRVLRFNDTRQSVAQVVVVEGGDAVSDPRAAAFEYVKTMLSLSLAVTHPTPSPSILCLGVGGGSVPLALAAAGAGRVVGVDLDSAVLAAAPSMGVTHPLPPGVDLVCGDAVTYVMDYAGPPFDLIVVDCFDGHDRVPPALTTAPFLTRLAAVLHPGHGAAIYNLHCGPGKPVWKALAASLGGGPSGPRFDTSDGSPGAAALAAATSLADAVIGPDHLHLSAVVSARRQQNAIAVAACGMRRDGDALAAAAAAAGDEAGLPFDAADRATFGLWFV